MQRGRRRQKGSHPVTFLQKFKSGRARALCVAVFCKAFILRFGPTPSARSRAAACSGCKRTRHAASTAWMLVGWLRARTHWQKRRAQETKSCPNSIAPRPPVGSITLPRPAWAHAVSNRPWSIHEPRPGRSTQRGRPVPRRRRHGRGLDVMLARSGCLSSHSWAFLPALAPRTLPLSLLSLPRRLARKAAPISGISREFTHLRAARSIEIAYGHSAAPAAVPGATRSFQVFWP